MNNLIHREDVLNASKIVYIECIYVDEEGYEETEMDNREVVFKSDILALPTVDAVEVVRCYKCKQSERMESPFGTVVHCHCWNKTVDYDGFCYEGY